MPGCQQFVAADEEELRKFKVSGTPAFFINGEFIGGGIPKQACPVCDVRYRCSR
jgi:protein-disulfide isomerase